MLSSASQLCEVSNSKKKINSAEAGPKPSCEKGWVLIIRSTWLHLLWALYFGWCLWRKIWLHQWKKLASLALLPLYSCSICFVTLGTQLCCSQSGFFDFRINYQTMEHPSRNAIMWGPSSCKLLSWQNNLLPGYTSWLHHSISVFSLFFNWVVLKTYNNTYHFLLLLCNVKTSGINETWSSYELQGHGTKKVMIIRNTTISWWRLCVYDIYGWKHGGCSF